MPLPALAIPLIMAVGGIAGSVLQSRAAGKSAEEQVQLYNDWLRMRQQGVNAILAAVQAKGYDPFGPQVTTREDQASQTSTTRQHQETRPVITEQYKPLEARFRNIIQNRLAAPAALPAGYTQAGVRKINQSYESARTALTNAAARRNLPASTMLLGSPAERARLGQIADFQVETPLKERAMRNEDLGLASGAISAFGKGQNTDMWGRTQTDSSGTSTLTSPPNLGALANLILPAGPMGSTASGQSTGGDILSGLSQLYFSNPSYFNSLFGQRAGGGGGVYDSNGNYIGE